MTRVGSQRHRKKNCNWLPSFVCQDMMTLIVSVRMQGSSRVEWLDVGTCASDH